MTSKKPSRRRQQPELRPGQPASTSTSGRARRAGPAAAASCE
jgi:hypothetical protein